MGTVTDLTLRAADGRDVRGRLRLPDGAVRAVAALCHPHPAFGGNLDVWLLAAVAEALAADGWATLRFDFRDDVGDGDRAVADLTGALDLLSAHPEPHRTAVVGWSFGALVGLLAGAGDPRITDWVGIAPPTRALPGLAMAPLPDGLASWRARRWVVAAEHDQFFPAAAAPRVHPDAVHVVAGADHFFFDHDDEVAAAVRGFLA